MSESKRGVRPRTLGANFTMRLEPAMRERIDQLAAIEKRPPAHMIRILIEEAIAARDQATKESS